VGLAAVCRAFGVDGLRCRRATGGVVNEHWFVGDALVLRRYNALRQDEQIAYEHAILGHLAQLGWPVAAPLPAPDGQTVVVEADRRFALFPRLPGRLRRGPVQEPRDPHALGALLGRLHTALTPNPAPPPRNAFPPVLGIVVDPIWRHVDLVPDPALRRRLRAHLSELADALATVDASTAVAGAVHGDWSEPQLLYRGDDVTGILDFDFVHPDLLIVDLAPVTSSPDIGVSVQFVRGYETERDLSETEVALVGLAQRARRLQFVWPAVHWLLHGNGATAVSHIQHELAQLEREKARWPALEAALRS